MNTLTAIEVGNGTLTAATVRANGQVAQVVSGGSAPLPDLDAGGVREALGRLGVTSDRAILLIPRGQALLRDLELPESTPEELVPMVRFQVEREMPLALDQIRYSYVETGRGGGKVRVQVAAVPRETLDAALAALRGAGLEVTAAYVSSFGLLSLYRNGGPAALVEVSGNEAEILVVDGGRMEFSRTAPIHDRSPEVLAAEVDRTLLAYAAKAPGKKVGKILIAGEGDDATALAQAIRARLARDVDQVGPGGLDTASVAGICVGVSRGAALPDLLRPPAVVKRFRFTRTHRWIAAGALLVAALVALSHVLVSGKEKALARKREELKVLEPRAAEVQRMSRQAALAQQWYRDRPGWAETVDALCQTIRSENLWIVSATFEDTGSVRLVGKARDDRQVTEFVTALKNATTVISKEKPFLDIQIEKVTNNNDKGEYRKDFSVNARLAGFEAPKKRAP